MQTLQQTKSHRARSGTLLEPPSSTLSSTLDQARMSSSSSVCSAASSLPPSALRKGKYDTTCHRTVQPTEPSFDLSIIHATYGANASLYNILRINPSADSNAIRRAYLKQGQKTLLDHGIANKNGNGKCKFATPEAVPKKLEDVPAAARKKFQAISIAYEILSTPELRSAYDAKELAKKQPVELTRVTSGNSVSWNPYVEEKIIEDSHPDEHSHRKKNEDGWLHMHLEKLDEEAQMFLNGDFLDELDESIASMSESLQESLGSLMRKGMGVSSRVTTSESDTLSYNVDTSKSSQEETDPSSLNKGTMQTIGDTMQSETLYNGKVLNVQTQFSTEIPDKQNGPSKQTRSLESPCSVMGVSEFVSDVVDETASFLADSFSGLLEISGAKKLKSAKSPLVTPTPMEELRALERKRLEEQLREGFGEPFYCPDSPHRGI